MSRQQAHMTTSNLQFSHIYICLKCLIVLLDILWIPLANTCTNWNRFAVFLRWNRRLFTRYRHENWHFSWFYFNMDKPAAPKNRLNIHCCRMNQIDIPPAQILSSKSTISSKALAEMVLLSKNSIWDMFWFLRASVLLSKEQSGTVDMAKKYKFASILTIYILIIQRTEEVEAIRMIYSMLKQKYMNTRDKKSLN